MAITINTNPASNSSVQDALWHVVTSDNYTEVDFKYVFDLYIGATQVARIKQFPEPSNGKGYFDAKSARNYLTYNWFEPTNTSVYIYEPDDSGEYGIGYTLKVGEEFGGTLTADLATATITAYNWVPPLFQRRVVTLADKLNNWLTNRPTTIYADLAENIFIGFYTDVTYTIHCAKYDSSNVQIGSTLNGASIGIADGRLQLNIGTTALAATLSTTFDSTVKYYEVWFNSLPKVRVYITCNEKFNPVLIHFLNRWGVYDTQRFDLVSKLMMDVERKSFGKRDYILNGTDVDYKSSSNRYYEGRINYLNKSEFTYLLTADAMSDADYVWMSDLISSPQILMEQDGYFYPVTVKQTNYEYSKFENNRLKPLQIEFELNTSRYSQLR
jgi:hypothetical protein